MQSARPLASGESILVVADYYSRWYSVKVMKSTTSVNVIETLSGIFSVLGLSLRSDNGPQFVSVEFREFMSSTAVTHHLTTLKWQKANGKVERQNRSLMKRIKIAYAERRVYRREIDTYLVAYRNTLHSIMGKSPVEMLLVANSELNYQRYRMCLTMTMNLETKTVR